ncbi:MAG: MlaD family protein [Desulfovibrio sp.]
MKSSCDYYKLGLFVVVGVSLTLFTLVVLAGANLFDRPLLMESYFNESINGLEIGSPVKYRGVKVGVVDHIDFAYQKGGDFFDTDYRYVHVTCALDRKHFADESDDEISTALLTEVTKGLRIRPVSLGLTGQLYLELDYLDERSNPPLPLSFVPKHIYIPSAPSIMNRIERAFANISGTLESISKDDIESIIGGVRTIVEKVSRLLQSPEGKSLAQELKGNLKETRKMFTHINDILTAPGAKDVLAEASGAAKGIRKIVDATDEDVIHMLKDMRVAMGDIRESSHALKTYLDADNVEKNMKSLGTALENIERASEKMNGVLTRVNRMVAGQETNVDDILVSTRILMENLRVLSEELKRYPAGALFGDAPEKVNLEATDGGE